MLSRPHYINFINKNHVSSKTVRRTLKQHGFKSIVKAKRPLPKAQHRKARLSFALKYQYWTVDGWKRVLWSDETKSNRIGSDGHQYVWKKVGEPLSDRITQPTVKHGDGNIMVWGCMGWNGVGMLAEIEGRMDSAQYVDTLDQHCPRALKIWRFQQMKSISSKIMNQSTPPRWYKNGFLKIRLRY